MVENENKSFSERVKGLFLAYYTNQFSLWFDRNFILSAVVSFLILYLSSIVNTVAGLTATGAASNAVGDIILDNIPRLDTSIIHGFLAGLVKYLSFLFLLFFPRYVPFTFKTVAGLILLRSVFINLTNIGIYPDAIPIKSLVTFGGDLFFSGHVANNFLLALIFWKVTPLRITYLFLTFLFGAGSLLGHYHYSIDVFAAPFFAYGVFNIAKRLFPEDFNLFQTGGLFTGEVNGVPKKIDVKKIVSTIILFAVLIGFLQTKAVSFVGQFAPAYVKESIWKYHHSINTRLKN